MRVISGLDASYVAVLAEHTWKQKPSGRLRQALMRMVRKIQDKQCKAIGLALVNHAIPRRLRKQVDALWLWVERNYTVHAPPRNR